MISGRNLWILGAVAAVILVAWIILIASFASPPEAAQNSAAPETTAPDSTTPTLANPGSGETTSAPAPETTESSSDPSYTPNSDSGAQTVPVDADPNYAGAEPVEEEQALVHDPLDTGAEPGSLGKTDLERVRIATDLYVRTAFDFDGGPSENAETRYRNLVFQTVMAFDFSQRDKSPGVEAVEAFAKQISTEGVNSEAELDSIEIVEQNQQEVLLDATFTVKSGDSQQAYKQRLTLAPWQAIWKVKYAKSLQEVA